jgi:HSP20 family molecular chaperone IbpA
MPTRRITLVRPSDVFRMFEDSMSSFVNDVGVNTFGATPVTVDVNIKQYNDRYEISVPVPGFKKDDIDISFDDDMLHLEGKIKEESKEEEDNYVIQEYKESSFKRTVKLPTKVDSEKADAQLQDGVLRINIPKLPEILPKKINIKTT